MKNVLIVEPDEVLRRIYCEFLESQDFRVTCAKNAQTAISKSDKQTPDLVILELQLVGHSGVEFLYEFRSYNEWQNVPIIINSHIPKKEFKENWKILSKELGIIDYLYKPTTSLKDLLAVVKANILLNA